MKIFLLICLAISPILANPANGTITEKDAIEKALNVLTSYHEIISDLNSNRFEHGTSEFGRFKNFYTNSTEELMENTKTALMYAGDNVFNAVQCINVFCSHSINVMGGYVRMFTNNYERTALMQKTVLSKILVAEVTNLREADTEIDQAKTQLKTALKSLTDLNAKLTEDHAENSVHFQTLIEAYESEAANDSLLVKEINGLDFDDELITKFVEGYTTPSPLTDKMKFILKMKARFNEMDQFYENFKKQVTEVIEHIEKTVNQLAGETEKVLEYKSQIDSAPNVRLDDEARQSVIDAANNFISQCRTYRNSYFGV